MNIVILGNAKTGMAFIGPFLTEGEANAYITQWKTQPNRDAIQTGVIALEAVTNFAAGGNLPNGIA